jgi:hypothetical protein
MTSTSEQAGNIAERVTRNLRRVRYHRAEGNTDEARAAEASLNGWLEQWARVVRGHVHDWDTSGRHRPPCCTTCGDRQKD